MVVEKLRDIVKMQNNVFQQVEPRFTVVCHCLIVLFTLFSYLGDKSIPLFLHDVVFPVLVKMARISC